MRAWRLGDGEPLGLCWRHFEADGGRGNRAVVDARLADRSDREHAHVRHERFATSCWPSSRSRMMTRMSTRLFGWTMSVQAGDVIDAHGDRRACPGDLDLEPRAGSVRRQAAGNDDLAAETSTRVTRPTTESTDAYAPAGTC